MPRGDQLFIWVILDALQKAGFPLDTERAADGNRSVRRATEAFKRALPLKVRWGDGPCH